MTTRRGPDIQITSGASPLRIARFKPVRDDIATRGKRYQNAAAARHAVHRDKGHSRVGGYRGRVDYNIYLDDTRGEWVSHLIEFGNSRTLGTHTLTGVPRMVAGGDSSA